MRAIGLSRRAGAVVIWACCGAGAAAQPAGEPGAGGADAPDAPVGAGQPENAGLSEGMDASPGGGDALARAAEGGADNWTFRAEPTAWFVAPGGDITLGGADAPGTEFALDGQFNLDEPGFAPLVELHARRGRWRATVSGYHVHERSAVVASEAGSLGGLTVERGDRLKSELGFTSVQAAGAYALAPYRARPNGRGGHHFVARLELTGGVRAHHADVDFAITPSGGSRSRVGADRLFVEPFGGLKGTLEVREQFTVDAEATIGGFSTGGDRRSFSADVMVGGTWRPVRRVGVQLGFRQHFFNLTDRGGSGDFEFAGANGGLFAGVEIRH